MTGLQRQGARYGTCTGHWTNATGDCLGGLAEGYILASDLCGPCTARFMAAVDAVTGRANRWHAAYRRRARQIVDPA
jgi:hypothetical protein